MGGWGSGRHGSKDTTDGYKRLDVRYLQKHQLLGRRYTFNLRWSRNGEQIGDINIRPEEDRITLFYRHRTWGGDEYKSEQYPVFLEWTPCNYGGARAWFRCPALRCGRRVAILYGGTIFACRHCHQLAYASQQESSGDRANSRAWAIHQRCENFGSLFDPLVRPKGMHQKTFRRLEWKYNSANAASWGAFAAKIGMRVEDMLL